jgi:hypothetical protein
LQTSEIEPLVAQGQPSSSIGSGEDLPPPALFPFSADADMILQAEIPLNTPFPSATQPNLDRATFAGRFPWIFTGLPPRENAR